MVYFLFSPSVTGTVHEFYCNLTDEIIRSELIYVWDNRLKYR